MTSTPGAERRLRTYAAAVASTLVAAGAIAACGGSSDTSGKSTATAAARKGGAQLTLVGYSTPKKAYDKLTTAFAQSSAGKGDAVSQSFGPSGAQSRAVASGQPADVVAFSTTPDVTRLVKAGVVSSRWDTVGSKGIPSDSVVVLVVRKGNPKHITGWDDLVKPGIDVITPNPATSGSARWNVLAGYGAQLREGKTPAQALAYIKTLLTKNTSVQPASGSSALQTFTSGKGDVLISYESEAIAAEKAGDALQHIIPKQTILIETPVAATTKAPAAAGAFVNWLFSPEAQTIWAQQGYRPVNATVAKKFASKFPMPPQLFTISTLGGWTEVDKKFFAASSGSITKIEQSAGVPTASS
jgi:sulfate transport system substrate-binding protein